MIPEEPFCSGTRVCIEKILGCSEPFLIHESKISAGCALIDHLRSEAKQLVLQQRVHDCVVVTQEEIAMMENNTTCKLGRTENNKGQLVHILLTLKALQLFPMKSDNFFHARFIDKDSEIVLYVKLDLGVSSSEFLQKKIDDSSVHVQVFQPSRLNDDSPIDNEHPTRKNEESALYVETNDSMSLLRVAMNMNQNRNDFGLSMLLQGAISRFFKRYSHFYAMFDEICCLASRGVLSRMVQLVQSEIQSSNSKCLVSGRTVTLRYRPGFINIMECLNRARKSGFGFSLLRHYIKHEEHLLRYILWNMWPDKQGVVAPFPCIYHDKQKEWSRSYDIPNDLLNEVPQLSLLKKLLSNRCLQTDKVCGLSDEAINQLLWLVLSNRVYLGPTTIPNSEDIFGSTARLYAFLSVDKSFEERYEKTKCKCRNPYKFLDKLALIYPQYHDYLFPTLTTPRRNPSSERSDIIRLKKIDSPENPEYALLVKHFGRVNPTSYDNQYGEAANLKLVVPRLFISYEPNYEKPKKPVEETLDVVSWCAQFVDTQY